jgi:DNA-binding NtrC family response regulator
MACPLVVTDASTPLETQGHVQAPSSKWERQSMNGSGTSFGAFERNGLESGLPQQAAVFLVNSDLPGLELLTRQADKCSHRVEAFNDESACISALSLRPPGAIFLDMGAAGSDGLETLRKLRACNARIPVIMLGTHEPVRSIVQAMRLGAFDFLSKPSAANEVKAALDNALEQSRLASEAEHQARWVDEESYFGLLGRSTEMRNVFRQIDRVSTTDLSVLVQGESGTGKELVARAIHNRSSRARSPFIALNSAAIPEGLIESELFGHERGAFTGAVSRCLGKVEQAHNGTLFLDEIGELALPLQAKLLRVIQEHQFQRLGGSSVLRSDFRLIAATHQNLPELIKAGRFREDLYFRLAVFEIDVPSLRVRKDDIPLLARKFIVDYQRASNANLERISAPALEMLLSYNWPGNVRELQNAIQRALLLCEGRDIYPEHLPNRVTVQAPTHSVERARGRDLELHARSPKMNEIEKDVLKRAIDRNDGNLSQAIRELEIGRSRFYRKLKKYDLMSYVENFRHKVD